MVTERLEVIFNTMMAPTANSLLFFQRIPSIICVILRDLPRFIQPVIVANNSLNSKHCDIVMWHHSQNSSNRLQATFGSGLRVNWFKPVQLKG